MDIVNKATSKLEPGDVVETAATDLADFGIPLVRPVHAKRPVRTPREVRNAVRTGAGYVVWFVDGTKSVPLHGRTAWEAWDA